MIFDCRPSKKPKHNATVTKIKLTKGGLFEMLISKYDNGQTVGCNTLVGIVTTFIEK